VANGGTVLTAATPQAGRAWPAWLAGGVALLAVAAGGVFWTGGGARLLLGVVGALAVARGATAAGRSRGAAGPALVAGPAVVAGLAAVAVAVASAWLAAQVLLVAVPAGLLAGAVVLLARGGAARRSGQAALVWWALVTGLLLATWLGLGWERAAGAATVVTGLAVGLFGVLLLVGGVNLRAVAQQPPPPARPAGCAGCACSGGGCGIPA
jgi:hypothetical protein